MSFKAITGFHSTFPIRLTVTRWHILPSRGSCHYWVYSKTYEVRGYFFEERELLKAVSLEKIVVYNEEKERGSNFRCTYPCANTHLLSMTWTFMVL